MTNNSHSNNVCLDVPKIKNVSPDPQIKNVSPDPQIKNVSPDPKNIALESEQDRQNGSSGDPPHAGLPAYSSDDFLFLHSDHPETKYYRRTDDNKKSIAWGQLKLLLSEIWFLSNYWLKDGGHPVIVYAGAADGRHIAFLSSVFFPEAEFHLYDSRPFKVTSSDKIHLYHRYFLDNDALRWADHQNQHHNVYLISDIRTADYRTMSQSINEAAIDEDNRRQLNWYRIIKPVAALLKFRPHYAYPFLPKTYRYLGGRLFKQPWAPQTSTECRLVPDHGVESEIDYDVEKYGNQMFHHNTVIRETTVFPNPFDNTESPIDYPDLLNDYDSTAHIQILRDYLRFRLGYDPDKEKVISLSRSVIDMLTCHLSAENRFTLSQLRQGIKVPGCIKPIRSVSQLVAHKISKGHVDRFESEDE